MSVIEWVLSGIAIVGFLGGATGVLYGASLKAANLSYKEDADALRGLMATKDAIIIEQKDQIVTMKGGIEILRETVGAGPNIAKLSSELAKQNKEVMRQLGSNIQASNTLLAQIGELTGMITTLADIFAKSQDHGGTGK